MKIVLQRVKRASVKVDGQVVGMIQHGILVLAGFHQSDTGEILCYMADKCVDLRIFEDAEGKMNLSLKDVAGEVLVVSQFTLYGDCRKGKRPSFSDAAPPARAMEHYQQFLQILRARIPQIQSGIFGARMEVELVNDGPVTLILEKEAAPTSAGASDGVLR